MSTERLKYRRGLSFPTAGENVHRRVANRRVETAAACRAAATEQRDTTAAADSECPLPPTSWAADVWSTRDVVTLSDNPTLCAPLTGNQSSTSSPRIDAFAAVVGVGERSTAAAAIADLSDGKLPLLPRRIDGLVTAHGSNKSSLFSLSISGARDESDGRSSLTDRATDSAGGNDCPPPAQFAAVASTRRRYLHGNVSM